MRLQGRSLTVTAGSRRLLDEVSIELHAGELVGLIGPNGAGKTTLLLTLLGLRTPDAGDVLLDEQPIERLQAQRRARALAYLPQNREVGWALPSRDVVMLGRVPYRSAFGRPSDACEAAVDSAMNAVDAQSLATRRITTLSGGERSRVLLARALAVQAPLLLADEPTADLDPYHCLHVMEILRQSTRGGTGVLAVLHDLNLASRFMDRLLLMHNGRIVADGPPREVLEPERLAEVYRIEALRGAHDGEPWVLPWRRADEN